MTDAPALQLAKVSKERDGGEGPGVDPCYFRRQLLEARDIYGGWEGEKCIHTHCFVEHSSVLLSISAFPSRFSCCLLLLLLLLLHRLRVCVCVSLVQLLLCGVCKQRSPNRPTQPTQPPSRRVYRPLSCVSARVGSWRRFDGTLSFPPTVKPTRGVRKFWCGPQHLHYHCTTTHTHTHTHWVHLIVVLLSPSPSLPLCAERVLWKVCALRVCVCVCSPPGVVSKFYFFLLPIFSSGRFVHFPL